jgi:hypothetical protein
MVPIVSAGHDTDVEIRQVKYPDNIVEQDHRAVKRRGRNCVQHSSSIRWRDKPVQSFPSDFSQLKKWRQNPFSYIGGIKPSLPTLMRLEAQEPFAVCIANSNIWAPTFRSPEVPGS